jgi:hypothetical protein
LDAFLAGQRKIMQTATANMKAAIVHSTENNGVIVREFVSDFGKQYSVVVGSRLVVCRPFHRKVRNP